MTNLSKILIPTLIIYAAYMIYILMPNEEIGDLDLVRAAGEINQTINVFVDKSKPIQKDNDNHVVAFYVKDKNGSVATVSPKDHLVADIASANVVELLGHMHGNNFVATRVLVKD